jgi:hypothetical protein
MGEEMTKWLEIKFMQRWGLDHSMTLAGLAIANMPLNLELTTIANIPDSVIVMITFNNVL